MELTAPRGWIAAALIAGLSSASLAADMSMEQMAAELAKLRNEVRQLRQDQDQGWLTERRAEEVKALIRDVLADADTRASLLEGGMTAGHNGKNFFLASEDGSFLLKISGQIQLRYIYNSREDDSNTSTKNDLGEAGFVIRRAKVEFAGHIADPRLEYALRLAVKRADNEVEADKILIAYKLTDTLKIWAGEDKAPFLREELISSGKQLAVERSYVNEVFTVDKVQGVGLKWDAASWAKVEVMISDGHKSGDGGTSVNRFTQKDDFDGQADPDDGGDLKGDRSTTKEFDSDASDFAISARVDLKLTGDWKQWEDFTSWPGEELAVFVGGAIHYEVGETGDPYFNNNFFTWTVDASLEYRGFNVYGAIIGQNLDIDDANTLSGSREFDLYGYLVQAGYNIDLGNGSSLEPFVRWEMLDLDDAITLNGPSGKEDTTTLWTFGLNWYHKKHNAKFTIDVVWAQDPLPFNDTGLGLLQDDGESDDQLAARLQYQLLF